MIDVILPFVHAEDSDAPLSPTLRSPRSSGTFRVDSELSDMEGSTTDYLEYQSIDSEFSGSGDERFN